MVLLQFGDHEIVKDRDYFDSVITKITHEEIIYPKFSLRNIEPEIPDFYKQDYLEACSVLLASPKASAALSRRLLQRVLLETIEIRQSNLAKAIDEFLNLSGVPSYLSNAIDAVRHVGNFAAHPLKDTHTGEIVDVEPGEAEWLLDVIEALFDFAIVQPQRLEAKRENLNQKLKAVGKPDMKP